MQCPACSTEVPDDDLFCENCGANLREHSVESAPACSCGAGIDELDEDGFCLRCGRRVRRPASDHIEEAPTPGLAAVSDRGLRHERNEDRFAVAHTADRDISYRNVMVVCDGVSATPHAELASAAVAEGVRQFLLDAPASALRETPEQLMHDAIAAGAQALAAQPDAHGPEPPSTTVVAALVLNEVENGVDRRQVTIGWVGDSRAYWIDANGARALTTDHSWRNDVVAGGQMTAEEADRSPQAHAITRWIGADAGEAAEPEIVTHTLPGPGLLLLCTDGLWNYAATPEAMAELLRAATADEADAPGIAERLIQFALDRGGVDNITAAVLLIDPV